MFSMVFKGQLGTGHYFPGGGGGGGGGGGYERFSSTNFFYNLYTSANLLVSEMQTNFFTHIVFASNFFCLFRL